MIGLHCKNISWLVLLATSALLQASRVSIAEQPDAIDPAIGKHFKQYCHRCHGETTQKGDRRLDQFPADVATSPLHMELLEEALDAMNRGEMPPKKKGVPQPTADETRQVIAVITGFLNASESLHKSTSTVMRRLNRREYCLLYTSPSPRDQRGSRMPSSA